MTSKNPPVLNTCRAPSSAGCCVCLQPALETSKAAVLQPLSKEEATTRGDSAEAAGLIAGGAEVGTRDSRAHALPRPHRASRACRAAERRLPGAGAGAHGDSGPDTGAPRPARWGRGGRGTPPRGPARRGGAPLRPRKQSPTREAAPRQTGPMHPDTCRHGRCSPSPSWGRAPGRGRGHRILPQAPARSSAPPPAPRRLRARVPDPGRTGPRGPRRPTHPPHRGPSRQRRPSSRVPGQAQPGFGHGSALTSQPPARPWGRLRPRSDPHRPGNRRRGSHSSSNPAPAFPAPPAPPAEPRLRDTAQAHT
ncbi:proline-rich protein 2-like [Canis lupus familiaris]|uniref:proline-rich protein 2-like n=1 Tax=Canis lupus familiaris TaxID=9615 RepID=UPI0006B3C711|nr:proline-rich protein 2-like [Canis lupus familiaris]XP_035556866.1 proline-rich protein 2-like [Canis lupus dingo]XP_038416572.1 proline-rich protein 2-like [Canis lupus familiaris]|eukprot:XP_013975703.1 proline-rich protein 2-like [Canis lupus familiaris]